MKDQLEAVMSGLAVSRLVSTIEYRLSEPLPFSKEEIVRLNWNDAADQMITSARQMLATRLERLAGNNGQVARDTDAMLSRMNAAELQEADLIVLLNSLARGRRTAFDAKTHRQVQEEYLRFNYIYLAAHLIEDEDAVDVEADLLEHLEGARATLAEGWGQVEFNRLGQNAARIAEMGPGIAVLGDVSPDLAPTALSDEQRSTLSLELGHRHLTEIYRSILLGAITELWVDYLTRVEALRISIGLEAYAQRDPLVQYKSKASEMFQDLLKEIRSGTVGRMFLYLPRMVNVTETAAEETSAASQDQAESAAARAGRKRHKKR
jgi:preprotein translocase subunit SecA